MTETSEEESKTLLRRYLQSARDALLWKLEGLSEYQIRLPMTPTGSNLLGLVKHAAGVELGYFGETFGRSLGEHYPWLDEGAEPNADMWATASESRDDVVGLYRRVSVKADEVIEELGLDATGKVPWWPPERSEVTLQQILVHVSYDLARHAGHADLIRELIDGSAGLSANNDNLPPGSRAWWQDYRSRLTHVAEEFKPS